ncbi:hypothetical protein Cni_G06573 [Canna indica]|uniref:AGC-kinase C-terminal domain-containing protein n=1 Tax=Canna indica TaxID=4628 RepID=A0AAQ3K1U8_9LILI|nr:hypothetical protein Cni_G06573 [Canna indica]
MLVNGLFSKESLQETSSSLNTSHFTPEARDLIDKLLDTNPTKRPSARPDGYASLKKHPFFKGID